MPDSGTTHTILKDEKYIYNLIPTKANVNIKLCAIDLIKGSGKASFILPNRIKIFIDNALFFLNSKKRKLLSFNDVYQNGYDVVTTN